MSRIATPARLGGIQHSTARLIIDAANEIGGNSAPVSIRLHPQRPGSLSAVEFAPIYFQCIREISAFVCDQEGRVPQTRDDYRFLCQALINCPTLEDAIHTAIAFSTAFFNGRGGVRSLYITADKAHFCFDKNAKVSTRYALICDLFSFLFYHNLFSWLIAEPLSGVTLATTHRKLIDESTLAGIIDFPNRFEQRVNTLGFDRSALNKSVARTYHELSQVLASTQFELMRSDATVCLSARVENLVRKALLLGMRAPSFGEITEALYQGEPTLRRNLATAGTSYQKVVDRCRAAIAIDLLKSPCNSIDGISDSLGFSATSAFSRAFKSWTGLTPGVYRQNVLTGPGEAARDTPGISPRATAQAV